MSPVPPVSGLILAGGRSTRLGRPKALAMVAGEPMMTRVCRAAKAVCDEIVVVTNDPVVAEGLEATVALEDAPHRGPLAGIVVGLAAAAHDVCLVLACDMPLVRADLLKRLVELLGSHDAVVPLDREGRLQPLHAVYHRRCLEAALSALASGERRADALAGRVRTVIVEEAAWEPFDPEGLSWWNVNTADELRAVELVLARASETERWRA